jgi:hypothetical protein
MTSFDVIENAGLIWFASLVMGLVCRTVNGIFSWFVRLIR